MDGRLTRMMALRFLQWIGRWISNDFSDTNMTVNREQKRQLLGEMNGVATKLCEALAWSERSFGVNSLNRIRCVARCCPVRHSRSVNVEVRHRWKAWRGTTSPWYCTNYLSGNSVVGLECWVCIATSVDLAKMRVKCVRDLPEAWWEWRILHTPTYMCDSGSDQSQPRSHILLPISDPCTNRHLLLGT